MTTQPTQDPVASESPRDLKYNAGKIDEFVTSLAAQYIDRLGQSHYTIEGLKQLVLQQINNLGWNLKGTFQGGGAVTGAGDLLQDASTGVWYRWDDLSTLPKNVPSGSTPASAGGTGLGKWQPVEVSDVLRKDLAAADGFKLIGRCATVAALRLVEPTINKQMISLVEYASGMGYGGGILWYDDADTTSADNGVDVFVTTGGKRWKRLSSRITLLDAGGVPGTDSSTAMQRLVDAKKGKVVIVPEGSFIISGITLNNSTYNNTHFVVEGILKLKKRASASETNAGMPAYMGILFKDVFNITGNFRWDGQRAIQPNEEHIYCIGIAGGGNYNIKADIREIRGDGFYISQSDWLANSAIPDGVFITGTVENSSKDGRNAVSIISGKNINIHMQFKNVGGTVGGSQQPGGIDFEPNYDYQVIDGFNVNVTAENCGYGVCVFGKAYNVRNGKIKAALIGSSPYLSRFRSLDIDISVESIAWAGNIDTAQASSIRIRHYNCSDGVDVGWRGELFNCNVTVIGDTWSGYVARTGKISRGSLHWEAYNCVSGGTGIALRIDTPQDGNPYTISGTAFSCDVHYDGVVQFASRNAGGSISFSQTRWSNSNLSGWSNFGTAVLGQLGNVRDPNTIVCNGFSTSNAQPGVGFYVAGDIVKPNTYTVSGGRVQAGWLRLTTGSGHASGTDWSVIYYPTP